MGLLRPCRSRRSTRASIPLPSRTSRSPSRTSTRTSPTGRSPRTTSPAPPPRPMTSPVLAHSPRPRSKSTRGSRNLLIATLSDPEFHRSAEEMGAGAFTFPVRARIDEGLDFLGPDSLRPFGAGDVPPSLSAADFADRAGYVDEVRDRSFARSALAASEETLERQAAVLAEGDASVRSRAPGPGSAPRSPRSTPAAHPPTTPGLRTSTSTRPVGPRAIHGARRLHPRTGRRRLLAGIRRLVGVGTSGVGRLRCRRCRRRCGHIGSLQGGAGARGRGPGGHRRRATRPDRERRRCTALADEPFARHAGRGRQSHRGRLRTGRFDHHPPARQRDRDGSFGQPFAHPPGHTRAVPIGTARSGSGTDVTPAAGTRSELYHDPVSFEGRSLEGAPRAGDPRELAQSLDGAELPVEDLPRVEPDTAEPARKSFSRTPTARPVSDSYTDLPDEAVQARLERARDNRRWFNDGTSATDSVWTGTMWSGDRRDVAALREANARWSEFAAAQRTSSVSFGDDPRQLTYLVEHEATVRSEKQGEIRRSVPRRRASEHHRPRPRRALHPQAPGLGAGTRDRIRPALAGVERVPVLAPRADRERAVEG